MRPSEIKRLKDFRVALVNFYTAIGKEGNSKLWVNKEILPELRTILEFYDRLFKQELTS